MAKKEDGKEISLIDVLRWIDKCNLYDFSMVSDLIIHKTRANKVIERVLFDEMPL